MTATSESTFDLAGSGLANHLGKMGYEGQVVITHVDLDTGVITDTLTETFTAANGDTLTLLCHHIATPVGPRRVRRRGRVDRDRGQGRFQDAEGSGTATTHVDLNAGTFSKELTGTLAHAGQ